jgi:hypothetical protein
VIRVAQLLVIEEEIKDSFVFLYKIATLFQKRQTNKQLKMRFSPSFLAASSVLGVLCLLDLLPSSEATFVLGALSTQAAFAIAGLSTLSIIKSKFLLASMFNRHVTKVFL